MSSKGFLIKTGGAAAALAAHAVFASLMLAGQPAPEQYLARLAPQTVQAPEVQMAVRQTLRKAASAETPAARIVRPTQLIRGLSAC